MDAAHLPEHSPDRHSSATAVPTELRARLRLEVGRFRAGEQRRRFDPTIHVGLLAGMRASVVIPAELDTTLDASSCNDVLLALVERAPAPSEAVWLTRPGTEAPLVTDQLWAAGARAAFASAGRPRPGCFVLTRGGWLDLDSGERQVWKRLRLD